MKAIETHNLSKQYGSTNAVDKLSMTVKSGEVYGFLGPNGSGKSTTIGMLLGTVYPTDGEVSVLGLNPHDETVDLHHRIGVLPEEFTVYPSLTGRDHLEFVGEMQTVDVDARGALRDVGLADAVEQPAESYSRGMKQRLGLAMALVGDPDLLVLDEPFTGLDPDGAEIVREKIDGVKKTGKTILFSSHILGQVEVVCDRLGILSDGKLVTEGTIEALRTRGNLSATARISLNGAVNEATDSLSNQEFVSKISTGKELLVEFDPTKSHLELVRIIESNGAQVEDIDIKHPTVEDIYRRFTR